MNIEILSIFIASIAAIHAVATHLWELRRARQEHARDLFADFYDAGHYRRVVAPVFRLTLKWKGLPDGPREAYQAAVLQGWALSDDNAEVLASYISEENLFLDDPAKGHFRHTISLERFTEHEALTAFLYFFTRADRLIQTNLVDRRLFAQLFCKSFAYYWPFLAEIRASVAAALPQPEHPSWIEASERIENLIAQQVHDGQC